MRPEGRCVLFTTNADNYIPLLGRLLEGRGRSGLIARLLRRAEHKSFPIFYRANTAARISELCQQTGLRQTTVLYAGNPFYLAFSPLLFYCALLFEKITDAPRLNCLKLYLITVLAKSEETTLSGYNSALGGYGVNLGYLKDSQYSATDLPVQIESNDQRSW